MEAVEILTAALCLDKVHVTLRRCVSNNCTLLGETGKCCRRRSGPRSLFGERGNGVMVAEEMLLTTYFFTSLELARSLLKNKVTIMRALTLNKRFILNEIGEEEKQAY